MGQRTLVQQRFVEEDLGSKIIKKSIVKSWWGPSKRQTSYWLESGFQWMSANHNSSWHQSNQSHRNADSVKRAPKKRFNKSRFWFVQKMERDFSANQASFKKLGNELRVWSLFETPWCYHSSETSTVVFFTASLVFQYFTKQKLRFPSIFKFCHSLELGEN